MRSVAIYLESANHSRYKDVLLKFAMSMTMPAQTLYITHDKKYVEADLHVIFGSWKDRKDAWHVTKTSVVSECMERNKPFVVLETPIMGRKRVSNYFEDDYMRVGINGFLGDSFRKFHDVDENDCSRFLKQSKELGIDIQPMRTEGDYHLVALQLPGDASLQGQEIEYWVLNTVTHLTYKYPNEKIIVRFPQIARSYDPDYLNEIETMAEFREGTYENLIPTLEKAKSVCTFSSGMGVDAMIAGVDNNFAGSEASFIYNWRKAGQDAETGRMKTLNKISWYQWSIDEITSGDLWNHLVKEQKVFDKCPN